MIKNKLENQSPILNLFSVSDKKIELAYSGEQISSDGGLLLLREVKNQIGLIDGSSSCIIDTRDQRYIDHTIKELITQRVFQIAAGYEDFNDSNDLRSDMNCKVCADRLPQTSKDLGS